MRQPQEIEREIAEFILSFDRINEHVKDGNITHSQIRNINVSMIQFNANVNYWYKEKKWMV